MHDAFEAAGSVSGKADMRGCQWAKVSRLLQCLEDQSILASPGDACDTLCSRLRRNSLASHGFNEMYTRVECKAVYGWRAREPLGKPTALTKPLGFSALRILETGNQVLLPAVHGVRRSHGWLFFPPPPARRVDVGTMVGGLAGKGCCFQQYFF